MEVFILDTMGEGQEFQKCYEGALPEVIASAPGRVNLIGEHVDYLEGAVVPVAIDRHLVIEASKSPHECFEFWPRGTTVGGPVKISQDSLHPRQAPSEGWLNYILGVIAGYESEGIRIPPFRAVIHSDLPIGAGLSSSAALETSIALVVEHYAGVTKTPLERALLCQRAEQEYAGVPCGIMDQLAVGACQAGHALLLDCGDLTMRQLPLPDGWTLLVTDSGVKHSLADGEYKKRREQCELVLSRLGRESFLGLNLSELALAEPILGELLFRRARHVVSEMARVEAFAHALEAGEYSPIRSILREGHESLRRDYEVSCDELDFLVDTAYDFNDQASHFGSRMTGGGFGGSVISLVHEDSAESLRRHLEESYEARFGRRPHAFMTSAVDGASLHTVESILHS